MKTAQVRPEHTIALSLLALSSSNVSKCRRGFVQILIIAVVALVVGAGAMYGYQKLATKPSPSPTPAIDQTKKDLSSETSVKGESANWKTYNSKSFSFKYPSQWAKSYGTSQ